KQLALLDSVHDQQQILEILVRFPGVLELLPRNGEQWFTQNAWRDFRRASRDRAGLPAAEDLRAAQGVVGALPDEIPHADKVLYIAGCAPLTMCGAKVENGRLALDATTLGDGKTTHESGRLPGVASWYIEAEHGELAHAEQSLPAIVELLETGTTRRLATSPSALARGGPTAFRYVPPPVLFPDARDFGAALIGRRLESRGKKTRAPIKVSVIHGDLRFASHPVMVGHYLGDTIAGAEAHLDRRLGGALSRRYQLGLYPGDLGSNTVALCEPTPAQKKLGLPRGAVVLGLGKMGELSAAVLAEAVRKGALEYLLQLTNAAAGEEPPYAAPIQKTSAEIGLTTLLIGCNSASSMAVEDCVGALVRGVARANQEIEQVFGGTARGASGRAAQSIRIAEVEIIELFIDTAVQATYAIAGMAKTLSSELNANIQAEPVLRQSQGGRQRLNQIANRDYWRRVVVTQVTSTNDGGNRRGALRFLAMSDRARAEITVQDRQPELIERLIGSSIRDTRFNRDHAKTLFELLVPNELKDSLTQQSWLVLVVDTETANYPWELLVDADEPLCARIGMVRQLETSSYRIQIRASTVKSAYVLGDPLTGPGIPPLPGAREEARLVADLLKRNQWNVNHNEERPSALDVLNRLFDRPYRILHLAGHGYFEQAGAADGKGRSGMLLEDGVYLTAVEIAKMRQVPDLVFLNCCHLGEIGAEAPPRGSATAYNKLAASISRELIEMGVRAVVAAGWAVRDDAAKAFARTFYEEMLHGRSFGRALREARNKVAEDFRDCNTWGAYQAYGDPDFKLDPQRDPEKASNGPEFVVPQELIQELMFIRRNVKAALDPGDREADKARKDTLKGIENMLAKCPPGWRNRGDVLAALGDAYGELLAFENAVDCYQRALATEDASRISMKVAEQLANLEVRWGEQDKSREKIEDAIARLDALLKLGKTVERLSILGSAWKRLAQLSEASKVKGALQHSANYYKQAKSLSEELGSLDPYPVINWLACEVLLNQPPDDIERLLARCEMVAAGRYAQSRAFADAGALHDAALLRAFLKGQIAEKEDEIVRGYEDVRDEANATPREFGSVLDQLDFMAGIMDTLGGTRSADVAALKRIHARLKGENVEPPNAPRPSKPSAAAETSHERNPSRRRMRVKRAV
ncbi:MAG TPA: CHAT domain-containing protein, partial [Burkholderiales bacterium]|nr:CHAT domain-containing protein [Burkholderiales bacterium]